MPSGFPHSSRQSAQFEEVCRRIFRHLLQRKESCRQFLSNEIVLSAASATNYTRWLAENGYLSSRSVKGRSSKRPVEWVRLSPARTLSIGLAISSRSVRAEIVDGCGGPLWSTEKPLHERRQVEVMEAINQVVQDCLEQAEERGQSCRSVGLSVSGTVGYGIVFSLDGVDDWRPCTPTDLLPAFKRLPKATVWTRIQCKLEGFAQSREVPRSLGYFEWDGGRLRMATMKNGVVIDGRNGTVSARLHQQVEKNGPLCYCGSRGCFVALLEKGEARCAHVRHVLGYLTGEDAIEAAAVEWRAEGEPLKAFPGDVTELVAVDDPPQMAWAGLRLLCAEEALLQAVRADRVTGNLVHAE